jgi:probable HAF family extracellular repeat protein
MISIAVACSDDDNGTGPDHGTEQCVPLTLLGTLSPAPVAANRATGINEAGHIVGSSNTNRGGHAVLWRDGAMIDLGTLGGSPSAASAINDADQVVGSSGLSGDRDAHAFLWARGVMEDLGTLGGTRSVANDINNGGWIVGSSTIVGDSAYHAFVWRNGAMTDLGTLGGSSSEALAVNDAGQVVGVSLLPGDSISRAFAWQNGIMTDLGFDGAAYDINESGHIVGRTPSAGAVLWRNGALTDLYNPWPQDEISTATAINDAGQIVGYDAYAPQTYVAFMWQDGVKTDLPTDGDLPTIAHDVNSAGLVVGERPGTNAEDESYAFLWDINCLPDSLNR